MIPPARPRQPPWTTATPRGPTSTIGRQSATNTNPATPFAARVSTWPSTSGGSDRRRRSNRPAVRHGSSVRRRGPGGRSQSVGVEAERRRNQAAILENPRRSSPVNTPRFRDANGSSLTPPRRVVKTPRAEPARASIQAAPDPSRHLNPAPSRWSSRRRLSDPDHPRSQPAERSRALPPGHRSDRRAWPERRGQASADPRALRHAGRDQVLAGISSRTGAPFAKPAVEPVGPIARAMTSCSGSTPRDPLDGARRRLDPAPRRVVRRSLAPRPLAAARYRAAGIDERGPGRVAEPLGDAR